MKRLFTSCFLLLCFIADCQKILKAVVVNESNKLPVNKATVFINGTSINTTTNERGEFSLKIPFGRHALICFAPGFETFGKFVNPAEIADTLTIGMKTSSQERKSTYQKNGWIEWGDYFLINFLGTNADVKDCKIKNPKVLHFQAPDDTGDFSASAEEPLIIENKTLGYIIIYKLESFRCNWRTLMVSYTGYSFFQPMSGTPTQQQEWEKRRKLVYYGSIMHFMRSVYRNQVEKEGFEMRPLRKVLNIPVKPMQSGFNSMDDSTKTVDEANTPADNDIADQIQNPDNYREVIGAPLTGDSVAYAIDTTTAGLYFENFLLVIYKGNLSDVAQTSGVDATSQLVLINKQPLQIEADGSFYDHRDLMVLGYWTWAQKNRWLLPFDYYPQNDLDP